MGDATERAAVLALVSATEGPWHVTADLIEQAGSALRLIERDWSGLEDTDIAEATRLAARVAHKALDRFDRMLAELARAGVRVLTVLDADYPANLRDVYNRPPMLFVKGELLPHDERAIAVVGTRTPSPAGLHEARHLAAELARRGVTVLSGLARGVDTAAHEAAIKAAGRTIAVMGTGILQVYPRENVRLAEAIARQGALVSQFWPDAPPTPYSFPMRNAVMSGMAIGTAVIEAGPKSGAKGQARLALAHGKRLFLVESLVSAQEWARRYAEHPATIVVRSADEILPQVERLVSPARELSVS